MPYDPTLNELSAEQQRQMTHQPEQPNPAQPYLDAVKNFASPLFDPAAHGGILGMLEGAGYSPPEWARAPQAVLNNPAFNQALLLETAWAPWELQFLKKAYSADIDPYALSGLIQKYLPGRSIESVRQKARLLGLRRPEIPPYVRQPGSPSVANDPKRAAQIAELLKKGMSSTEIASEMGDVSARTVRRYINENLNRPRMGGRGGSALPPSMPSFESLTGPDISDKEYKEFEKIIEDFFAKNPEYR